MRGTVEALRVVQNLVSTRTWILNVVCSDFQTCNDIIKESNSLKTFYDAFATIGCSILLIYFISSMIQHVTNDELTIDAMVREFVKLMIGVLFIKNGYPLLSGISDFGYIIANGLFKETELIYINTGATVRYSFWDTVFAFTMLIPNFIYFLIALAVSKIVIFGRMVELALYICVAPLALSDLPVGGISSNGYKFIKKVLAISLQGVVIVLGVLICQQFSEMFMSIENLSAGNFINNILIGIIMIKILISSKSISEDIVGSKR